MHITAIQTRYNGYLFRSRLEARWAVFMDEAGIPYSYESEGFEISARIDWLDKAHLTTGLHVKRFYLPDFWLPVQEHYVEIKPALRDEKGEIKWPDDEMCQLQVAFEQQTGKSLIIVCGEPGYGHSDRDHDHASYSGFTAGDYDYEWCECGSCGAIGLQYYGRAERNIHRAGCSIDITNGHYGADTPRLRRAHDRARAARFEHGATP